MKDNEAIKAGLADRIDTLDGTIQRMVKVLKNTKPGQRAFSDMPSVDAKGDDFRKRRHAHRSRFTASTDN